jgi:hypothetical protein
MKLIVTYDKHDRNHVTWYAIHTEDFKDLEEGVVNRIVAMAPKVLGDAYLGYENRFGDILQIKVRAGSMKKGQGKFENRAFFGWVEIFMME